MEQLNVSPLFFGILVFYHWTNAAVHHEPQIACYTATSVIRVGLDIDLVCEINNVAENCHETRQWLIGYLPRLICENGKCINTTYSEEQKGICTFKLTVANIDTYKLTSVYTFQYNFQRFKFQPLLKTDVIVLPLEDNTKAVTTECGDLMYLTISLNNFFPSPHCTISLDNSCVDRQKTHIFTVEKDRNLFYKAELSLPLSTHHEFNELNVLCKIRGQIFSFPIRKHFLSSTNVNKKDNVIDNKLHPLVFPFSLISLEAVAAFLSGFYLFWKVRQYIARDERPVNDDRNEHD